MKINIAFKDKSGRNIELSEDVDITTFLKGIEFSLNEYPFIKITGKHETCFINKDEILSVKIFDDSSDKQC